MVMNAVPHSDWCECDERVNINGVAYPGRANLWTNDGKTIDQGDDSKSETNA